MLGFELPDEETLLLKDTASRFVADHYGLTQRAAMLQEPPQTTPTHWAEMADLGWLAAPVPEDAGGLGLSMTQVVPFFETLGAGLVLEPIGSVAMHCTTTLARALPADASLEPILLGKSIEVIASGAPNAPIVATIEGDEVRVNGTAPLVMGGAQASVFWVVALLEDAQVLVRVTARQALVAPFRLVDGQAAAKVSFDDVRLAASTMVPQCDAALAFGRDMALVSNQAEMSGLIDALHQTTLDYVKLREQFGRPIGRFQSVQHRMADLFIKREEAHSMVRLAAEAMDSDDVRFRTRLVSAAQVKIAENARAVACDAVQLHGGMGVTDELAVGHMVKRLLVLTQINGSRAEYLKQFRDAA